MKNYSKEQLREYRCESCRNDDCNIPCQIRVIRADVAALEKKVDENNKLLKQILERVPPKSPVTRWENVDV